MERQHQAFRFSLFDTVEYDNPLIGNVRYNDIANSTSPVGHGCKLSASGIHSEKLEGDARCDLFDP